MIHGIFPNLLRDIGLCGQSAAGELEDLKTRWQIQRFLSGVDHIPLDNLQVLFHFITLAAVKHPRKHLPFPLHR